MTQHRPSSDKSPAPNRGDKGFKASSSASPSKFAGVSNEALKESIKNDRAELKAVLKKLLGVEEATATKGTRKRKEDEFDGVSTDELKEMFRTEQAEFVALGKQLENLIEEKAKETDQTPARITDRVSTIWKATPGRTAYRVPIPPKARATRRPRSYRDAQVTHGFPVANLREFFFHSRTLVSAGYDSENRRLFLKFAENCIYEYADVPEEVVIGLLNAPSHGRYAHWNICYSFKYQRVTHVRNASKAASRPVRESIKNMTVEEKKAAFRTAQTELKTVLKKLLGIEEARAAKDTRKPKGDGFDGVS
jgi:hypothetical protein